MISLLSKWILLVNSQAKVNKNREHYLVTSMTTRSKEVCIMTAAIYIAIFEEIDEIN